MPEGGSFLQKDEFVLAYVGFDTSVEHSGGDIKNTIVCRSWSSRKKFNI